MSTAARNGRGLWRIFRWPLAFTLLSVIGLIAALVGNGLWDALSWLTLGALPAAMIALLRR